MDGMDPITQATQAARDGRELTPTQTRTLLDAGKIEWLDDGTTPAGGAWCWTE